MNIAQTRVAAGKRNAISPLPFGDGPSLSREGWTVIRRAEDEARRLRFDIVERAHLFLALLSSDEERAQAIFGDSLQILKTKTVERLDKKSPRKDARIIWQTKAFQKTLDRAAALADEHGSGIIGPVQLLHALLGDPGDTMNRVLPDAKIDVRAAISRLTELANQDPQRASYLEFKSSHPAAEE